LYRHQRDVEALLKSDSALARNLRNEKKMIEDAGVRATIRIGHGIVIDQILNEVIQGDHDLVVAGSWAIRDRWRTYIVGNITREIVNRTDRPVLVIRSDKEPKSLVNRLRRMVTRFGSGFTTETQRLEGRNRFEFGVIGQGGERCRTPNPEQGFTTEEQQFRMANCGLNLKKELYEGHKSAIRNSQSAMPWLTRALPNLFFDSVPGTYDRAQRFLPHQV
jgi:hypothetical protein